MKEKLFAYYRNYLKTKLKDIEEKINEIKEDIDYLEENAYQFPVETITFGIPEQLEKLEKFESKRKGLLKRLNISRDSKTI